MADIPPLIRFESKVPRAPELFGPNAGNPFYERRLIARQAVRRLVWAHLCVIASVGLVWLGDALAPRSSPFALLGCVSPMAVTVLLATVISRGWSAAFRFFPIRWRLGGAGLIGLAAVAYVPALMLALYGLSNRHP